MEIDKSKLSPMMKHYLDTKEEYKDCILFYRLGDFYEMFFDDALLASRVLGIALTGKACGLEERAPMCGIPYHSVSSYLTKLIQAGYKVAIGEQVEDPATAKGLVKREVVKIVTPGTLLEDDNLENTSNNYLMAVYFDEKNEVSISYTDISTGELNTTVVDPRKIKYEIAKVGPRELITNKLEFLNSIRTLAATGNIYLNENFDSDLLNNQILNDIFDKDYLDKTGVYKNTLIESSLSIVLNYIRKTQMISSNNINKINVYRSNDYMVLDLFTRVNLELTKTIRNSSKKGSLLQIIDSTSTPMGARMLRKFIEQPLVNVTSINRRLDITQAILDDFNLRQNLKESLERIYDLERICAKVAYDKVSPKDMVNLKNSISKLPEILGIIKSSNSPVLDDFRTSIDCLEDIYKLIDESILDEPSQGIKDGNIIKSQYSKDLYELRDIYNNGSNIIRDIEKREKEKTGAKTLKIGYNKVFGYYIEITKAALVQVELDDSYIRKQTLVNAERFITPELKEVEDKIINAEDKIKSLEYSIFKDIRNVIYNNIDRIQNVANIIAELDVYVSNAIIASKNSYSRPMVSRGADLEIIDGRHPVIEEIMGRENFISNNTSMTKDNIINIITGPNMSGKSTYMRQTALICLMAHIGSFVPASSATIPILDRIFTRVGASDDLSQGQSTFMVEMDEVSQILKNATKDSLIILDEVGRGTSTYDGISLAWSIVEYIHDKIGAKTLFATHYHELTNLEDTYDRIKNYSVDVKEDGDNIIFLRKIVDRAADRSYGIYVAKLAKLPDDIIKRAGGILEDLEKNHLINSKSLVKLNTDYIDKSTYEQVVNPQEETSLVKEETSLVRDNYEEIVNSIKSIDMMNTTPLELMNIVYQLQEKVKNIK